MDSLDTTEGDSKDILNVANPTSTDFTVEYGKVPHKILAGENRLFTRDLAEHICKHLTDREILAVKKNHDQLNDPATRLAWRNKIILGVAQSFVRDKPLTPGERIALENEVAAKKLNDLLAKAENMVK